MLFALRAAAYLVLITLAAPFGRKAKGADQASAGAPKPPPPTSPEEPTEKDDSFTAGPDRSENLHVRLAEQRAEIGRLNQTLAAVEAQADTSDRELMDTREKLSIVQGQLTKRNAELVRVNEELAAATPASPDSSDNPEYDLNVERAKTSNLVKDLATVSSELDQARKEAKDATEKLSALHKELGAARNEITERDARIAELTESLEAAQASGGAEAEAERIALSKAKVKSTPAVASKDDLASAFSKLADLKKD